MTDIMANFEVYEKIENMAKRIAKPWQYTTFLLGFLLLLSVCGNIYLATQEVEVVLEADENTDSVINQTQG